jgi:hypothetical protein
MENGILVERKYLPDPDVIEPEILVPRWQPKNMSQYLYFNSAGALDVNASAVLDIYKSYQSLLQYSHD